MGHKWNQYESEWGRYGPAWVANAIDGDRDEIGLHPIGQAWIVNGTDIDRDWIAVDRDGNDVDRKGLARVANGINMDWNGIDVDRVGRLGLQMEPIWIVMTPEWRRRGLKWIRRWIDKERRGRQWYLHRSDLGRRWARYASNYGLEFRVYAGAIPRRNQTQIQTQSDAILMIQYVFPWFSDQTQPDAKQTQPDAIPKTPRRNFSPNHMHLKQKTATLSDQVDPIPSPIVSIMEYANAHSDSRRAISIQIDSIPSPTGSITKRTGFIVESSRNLVAPNRIHTENDRCHPEAYRFQY